MCILDELYYEWHAPQEKPQAELQEKWGQNEDLWARAEKVLDAELLDELQRSIHVLMDLESCREFQEGFRLGVQLMLELNVPVPPQGS